MFRCRLAFYRFNSLIFKYFAPFLKFLKRKISKIFKKGIYKLKF